MKIIISNHSELPIYAQIRVQLKEQIMSGSLPEGSTLPSMFAAVFSIPSY